MAVPSVYTVGLFHCQCSFLDITQNTDAAHTQTAPPDPHYPRIISSLLTLPYESMICRQVDAYVYFHPLVPLTNGMCENLQAYPPGEHFQVPPLPDITAVNVLGDFAIAADRLAIIDGQGS